MSDSKLRSTGQNAASSHAHDALVRQFHQAMLDIYRRAKQETGYTPTYFLQMVDEMGGLEAARRLLAKNDVSDGLTELYLRNRLDLTVEAHVVRPEFRPLFTSDEVQVAERRLRELDYPIDA